ncbi:DNA-binding protein [Paraburkholderia bannensis]|uniref:DNA-binding protein n=1 Tax=Paraburkholderia bannensis TaxID=765414 RepID=UPI002ABD84CE|nr:DNA-binding protein [Paraburkholderia bannensis]
MSRISDTRLRTRETASRLVAEGKRPHELTVDLIYAEIRQGSRTTINDELKQWKDEKTRSDALASQLPPAVADAMLGIWAVAVEHGEKVYDARVAELEHATLQAESRASEAIEAREAVEETLRLREVELAALGEQVAALKQQLEAANARAEEARSRADSLETQRDAERELADTRLREQRIEHEQASATLRASLEARDTAFQAELDKATQRMEGVQKHMLQQISEAREERRRADSLAASLQQRNETLLGELGAARATQASQDDALSKAQRENEVLMRERGEWQRERTALENRLSAIRNRSRSKLKRVAVAAPRGGRGLPPPKQ